jgi:hypothetical protein
LLYKKVPGKAREVIELLYEISVLEGQGSDVVISFIPIVVLDLEHDIGAATLSQCRQKVSESYIIVKGRETGRLTLVSFFFQRDGMPHLRIVF